MANSKDLGNNIFRDWIFPSLGILIGIAAIGFGQSIFYGLVFLMMIIIAIIFGHKCGFRILRYTNKLKYISQVTKHTFNKVEKEDCLSNQYDQEINNLRIILPTYLPEFLLDVSNDNSKEIELCRTSIACSDGYNKIHNLEKVSMLFPIFSRLARDCWRGKRIYSHWLFAVRKLGIIGSIASQCAHASRYWHPKFINRQRRCPPISAIVICR